MHLTEGSFQIDVYALWEKCTIDECKCNCNIIPVSPGH